MKKLFLLFIIGLLPMILVSQVQVRLPDTTVMAGATVHIPVYVDSSLNGLGVYSYQLQVTYTSGRLNPIGLLKAGTLTEAWSDPLFNQETGKFTFIAAGATPLSGKGVLVYLVCETINTSPTSLNFSGSSHNFFNEGIPPLTFVNGYISKTTPPSINISPSVAVLAKGETQQFQVSGQGTPPFSWGVTNSAICSVNANGLLSTSDFGTTKVYCTDAAGLSDTTGVIDIRAVRVTLPQSNGNPQQIVTLPVSITNTDELGIISGEIEYTYNQNMLSAQSLYLDDCLLENVEVVLFDNSQAGKIVLTFAGSVQLSGEGILFAVTFQVANQASGSTNLSFQKALFNENLPAKMVNGAFVINYINLTFSPNTAELVAGNQIEVTVSGGTPPYQWEMTNPEAASIWNFGGGPNALITALDGGTSKIKVTDITGFEKLSGDFIIFDTELKIISTSIPIGSNVLVPLSLSSMQAGKEISSFEIDFQCHSTYLEFWGIVNENTLTTDWELLHDINGNNLSVVGASANAIDQNGILFYLLMYARPNLPVGTNAWINITGRLFNEGSPTSKTVNGQVTGSPAFPNIQVSPLAFTEELPAGASVTRQITVGNTGIHNLIFSATVNPDSLIETIVIQPYDSIVEPGSNSTIEFEINTSDLDPGNYTAEILISSNDSNDPVIIITILLEVTDDFFDIVQLYPGWNLISFDVFPNPDTPIEIFSSENLTTTLEMVTGFQNQTGVFYDPNGLPFLNTLTQMFGGEGYWVKVETAGTLTIYGTPIPDDHQINLLAGWSLIGYWLDESTPPEVAFAPLITGGILEMVTGYEQGGLFFDPNGLPFLNTLTEIKNEMGYWVKVNSSASFVFPQ